MRLAGHVGLAFIALQSFLVGAAMAEPRLTANLKVQDGFIALDRNSIRLEMGPDGGGPYFTACHNLSPADIEAQAIRLVEKQLHSRGKVLRLFAVGTLDPDSQSEAVKEEYRRVSQSLEREIASDKETAALNVLSASWTEAREALEAWKASRQNASAPPFIAGKGFHDQLFAATLDDPSWFDGPARVPKDYYENLQNTDFQAYLQGAVAFDIAPPFRMDYIDNDRVISMLRPTANIEEWGNADNPLEQTAGRLKGSLKDMSDELLGPLHCKLWDRSRHVARAQDYFEVRGVSVGEYQQRRAAGQSTTSTKPATPPPFSAGVDPEPTDASLKAGGGRVLLSPDPLANRLFAVLDDKKDAPLLRRVLYLTLPTSDWNVVRDLPRQRLCFLDALKRGSGTRAVRLSFVTSPDLAFSRIYLTRRAIAERTQRLVDLGYDVKLGFNEVEGRKKYASVLVEPKAGSERALVPEAPLTLQPCAAEDGSLGEAPAENVKDVETAALVPQSKVAPEQRTKEQPKHEIKIGVDVGAGLAPKLWAGFALAGLSTEDSVAVEAAQQTHASADIAYSRDFVGFDSVFSRRVQLSIRGFSLIDPAQKTLAGQGELRRRGLEGRATADLFRDWNGMFAQADLTAEKHSVRDLSGTTALPDVSKLSVGLNFARSIHATRRSPHTEFGLSFSRGHTDTGGMFRLVKADAAHQQFVGAFSRWDFRANASSASASAPASEWPKFGGEDSVRGYAADATLARRTWAIKNEYWFLPPGVEDSESSVATFLRRSTALAVFADVGGFRSAPTATSDRKVGMGAGLRVVLQDTFTLRLDWARPFQERDPTFDRKGQWYLTVTTRRQL